MSYETELNIALKVTDGPAITAQKTKSPKECWSPEYYCSSEITQVQSKRIVLDSDHKERPIDFPNFLTDAEYQGKKIGFVAISADKYTFKDNCGKDAPGIFYWSDTYATVKEVLDGPHIYFNRHVQPLEMKKLTFKVCDQMFACIKEPEKKKATITVTFGIAEVKDCGECKPCTVSTNGKLQADEQIVDARGRTRSPSYA